MQKISDPPHPTSSWASTLTVVLCLAAGGVVTHRLLQKAPAPFHLPPLTDQHPRDLDALAASPAESVTSLDESLEPSALPDPAPRDLALPAPAPRDPAPPARIERRDVLTVRGNDSADAGSWVPSERVVHDVEAAQADAAPPTEPPPAEPPRAEPPLPLAETVPFADTTAEAEPPLPLAETVPLADTASEAQPPEAQPPELQPPEVVVPGEPCGFITCAPGFGCCNPSCGICVLPGATCDPQPCR